MLGFGPIGSAPIGGLPVGTQDLEELISNTSLSIPSVIISESQSVE